MASKVKIPKTIRRPKGTRGPRPVAELVAAIAEQTVVGVYSRAKYLHAVRHPEAAESLVALLKHKVRAIRQGAALNPLLTGRSERIKMLKESFSRASDKDAEAYDSGYQSILALAQEPDHQPFVEDKALRYIEKDSASSNSFRNAVIALVLLRSPKLLVAIERWLDNVVAKTIARHREAQKNAPKSEAEAAIMAMRQLKALVDQLSGRAFDDEWDDYDDEMSKGETLFTALACLGPTELVDEQLLRLMLLVAAEPSPAEPDFNQLLYARFPLAANGVRRAAELLAAEPARNTQWLQALGPVEVETIVARLRGSIDRDALAAYELLTFWDVQAPARQAFMDRFRDEVLAMISTETHSLLRGSLIAFVAEHGIHEAADPLAALVKTLTSKHKKGNHWERWPALRALAKLGDARTEALALAAAKQKDGLAEETLADLGTDKAAAHLRKLKGDLFKRLGKLIRLPGADPKHVAKAARYKRYMPAAIQAAAAQGPALMYRVFDSIAKNDDTFGYDVHHVRAALTELAADASWRPILEDASWHQDARIALIAREALDGVPNDAKPKARGVLAYFDPKPGARYPALDAIEDAGALLASKANTANEEDVVAKDKGESPFKFAWSFSESTMAGLFVGRKIAGGKLTMKEVKALHAASFDLARTHQAAFALVTAGDWIYGVSDEDEAPYNDIIIGLRVDLAMADSGPSGAISLKAIEKVQQQAQSVLSKDFWKDIRALLKGTEAKLSSKHALHFISTGPLCRARLVYGAAGKKSADGCKSYRGTDMGQMPHEEWVSGITVKYVEWGDSAAISLTPAANDKRTAAVKGLKGKKGYFIVPYYD